jgi:predicted small lipoprotein YifL
MPPHTARRLAFALVVLPPLFTALAGCGRKGPLELPSDVQTAREARAQQLEAETAAKARAGGRRPKLSEEGSKPKIEPVEGERGHRPPGDYPFLLDPLL